MKPSVFHRAIAAALVPALLLSDPLWGMLTQPQPTPVRSAEATLSLWTVQAFSNRLAAGFVGSTAAIDVRESARLVVLSAAAASALSAQTFASAPELAKATPLAAPLSLMTGIMLWPVLSAKSPLRYSTAARFVYGIVITAVSALMLPTILPQLAPLGISMVSLVVGTGAAKIAAIDRLSHPGPQSLLDKLQNNPVIKHVPVLLILMAGLLALAHQAAPNVATTEPAADRAATTTAVRYSPNQPLSFGVGISKIERPLYAAALVSGRVVKVARQQRHVQANTVVVGQAPLAADLAADLERINGETGGLVAAGQKNLLASARQGSGLIQIEADSRAEEDAMRAQVAAYDNAETEISRTVLEEHDVQAVTGRAMTSPAAVELRAQKRIAATKLHAMLVRWHEGHITAHTAFDVTGEWIAEQTPVNQGQPIEIATAVSRPDRAKISLLPSTGEALAIARLWAAKTPGARLVFFHPSDEKRTHPIEVSLDRIVEFDPVLLRNGTAIQGRLATDPTSGVSDKVVECSLIVRWEPTHPVTDEDNHAEFEGVYEGPKRVSVTLPEGRFIGVVTVGRTPPITPAMPQRRVALQAELESIHGEIQERERLIAQLEELFNRQFPHSASRLRLIERQRTLIRSLRERAETLAKAKQQVETTGLNLPAGSRAPLHVGSLQYWPADSTGYDFNPLVPVAPLQRPEGQWVALGESVRLETIASVFRLWLPGSHDAAPTIVLPGSQTGIPLQSFGDNPRERTGYNVVLDERRGSVSRATVGSLFPPDVAPHKTFVEIQYPKPKDPHAGESSFPWLRRVWKMLFGLFFLPSAGMAQHLAAAVQQDNASSWMGMAGTYAGFALALVFLGVGIYTIWLVLRHVFTRGQRTDLKPNEDVLGHPAPSATTSPQAETRSRERVPPAAESPLRDPGLPGIGSGVVPDAVIDRYMLERRTFGRVKIWDQTDRDRLLDQFQQGLSGLPLSHLQRFASLLNISSQDAARQRRSAAALAGEIWQRFYAELSGPEALDIQENLSEGPGRLAMPVTMADGAFRAARRQGRRLELLSQDYFAALSPEGLVLAWISLLAHPRFAFTQEPESTLEETALAAYHAQRDAFETRLAEAAQFFADDQRRIDALRRGDMANDPRLWRPWRDASTTAEPLSEEEHLRLRGYLTGNLLPHEGLLPEAEYANPRSPYVGHWQRHLWHPAWLVFQRVPLLGRWLDRKTHRILPHRQALRILSNERERVNSWDTFWLYRSYRNKKNKSEFGQKIYHYRIVAVLVVLTAIVLVLYPDFRNNMLGVFGQFQVIPLLADEANTGVHSFANRVLNPMVKYTLIGTLVLGAYKLIGETVMLIVFWLLERILLFFVNDLFSREANFQKASHGMSSEEMFDIICNAEVLMPAPGNQDDYREDHFRDFSLLLERFGLEWNRAMFKQLSDAPFSNPSSVKWLVSWAAEIYSRREGRTASADIPLVKRPWVPPTREQILAQLRAQGWPLDTQDESVLFAAAECGRVALAMMEMLDNPSLVMAWVAHDMSAIAQNLGPHHGLMTQNMRSLIRRSVMFDPIAFSEHRRWERLMASLAAIDGARRAFESGDTRLVDEYIAALNTIIPPDDKGPDGQKSYDRHFVEWQAAGFTSATRHLPVFPMTLVERVVLLFKDVRTVLKTDRDAFTRLYRHLQPLAGDYNPLAFLTRNHFLYRTPQEGVGNGAELMTLYLYSMYVADRLAEISRSRAAGPLCGEMPFAIDVTLLENERESMFFLDRLERFTHGTIYFFSLTTRSDVLLDNLKPRIKVLHSDLEKQGRLKLVYSQDADAALAPWQMAVNDTAIISSAEIEKFLRLGKAKSWRVYGVNPFALYDVLLQFIAQAQPATAAGLPSDVQRELRFLSWMEERLGLEPTTLVEDWSAMRGHVLGQQFNQSFIIPPHAEAVPKNLFDIDWTHRATRYHQTLAGQALAAPAVAGWSHRNGNGFLIQKSIHNLRTRFVTATTVGDDVIALWQRTVWGDRGARYRLAHPLNYEFIKALPRGTMVHRLEEARQGTLLGARLVRLHEVAVGDILLPAAYHGWMSIEAAVQGHGLGRRLAEESLARLWLHLDHRGIIYSYVDPTNQRSQNNLRGLGYTALQPFTWAIAIAPKPMVAPSRRVREASPQDKIEIGELLAQQSARHALFDIATLEAPLWVIREGGRLLAAGTVHPEQWSFDHLPIPMSAWVLRQAHRLPVLRQGAPFEAFTFAKFSNVYLAEDAPEAAVELFGHLLFQTSTSKAVFNVAKAGPVYRQLTRLRLLGLFNRLFETPVDVLAHARGLLPFAWEQVKNGLAWVSTHHINFWAPLLLGSALTWGTAVSHQRHSQLTRAL